MAALPGARGPRSHRGFVWPARAAGLIGGADAYLDGIGWMAWRLAGVVTVAQAAGPDVSRSAAGRAGAEACWLPTSLLPRFGVGWSAVDDGSTVARFDVDDSPIELRFRLDARPAPLDGA